MADDLNDVKPKQKLMDVVDRRLSPMTRSHPQHSKTLRRESVSQPKLDIDRAMSIPISTDHMDPINPDLGLSESASLTQQSPLISRFAASDNQAEGPEPNTYDLRSYPSMEQDMPNDTESMDIQAESMSGSGELAAEWPNLRLDNLLPNVKESKVKHHKSKWHKAKHISGWTILAIVLVGVIGGGILINRNVSKLELYLASSKVGFSATLPSIRPSGFDLSSIATGSGALEASFKSNSDGRNYSITEKKSSISNNELLTAYVEPQAGGNYQTINTAGRAIYIYNGHDATWIFSGIWYTLTDNNSLSDSQIINIATST